MAEKKELVTRDYTRKAAKAYRDRHDMLSLTLDNGERERFRSVGLDNKTIIEILRAEYEKRTGESSRTQNTETTNNPMPKPTEPEQKPETEKKDDIPFFD